MKKTIALAAALVGATFALPASAGVVFMDDFSRSNSSTVGNGWSEIERHSNDVGIYNGFVYLRDDASGLPDAAIAQASISVPTGTATLMWDWGAGYNTESSDRLYVDYRVGTGSWTQLASYSLGGSSFVTDSAVLGLETSGAADVTIRFWTNVSSSTEYAKIDNVKLTSVPEPSTVALIGLGLLGMGIARRQRKTA